MFVGCSSRQPQPAWLGADGKCSLVFLLRFPELRALGLHHPVVTLTISL